MFKLKRSKKNDLKPVEAYELISNNETNRGFVILDVRSPEEYAEAHIENAQNINYNSTAFKVDIEKLDKNKRYLVYCRSGHRSSRAVKIMEKLGFTDIQNLAGGIMKWEGNKLPLI
jgi:rhodanese-related sulfurtransferase